MPLERVAYAHVAGGMASGGRYHDTHTDPVPDEVLELISELRERAADRPRYCWSVTRLSSGGELRSELDAIARASGYPVIT